MTDHATDDHRFLITTTWGDTAYGDTIEEARQARRTLAADHGLQGCDRSVTILDRGPAAPEART